MTTVTPPPPAPKPETQIIEGAIMGDFVKSHYLCVGQSAVIEYKRWCQRERKDDNTHTIFFSLYRAVTPVIQNGPVCGLVALAMAMPLMGVQDMTPKKLLEIAIHQGYTKQGEMFSAADMCRLVQSVAIAPYISEVLQKVEETHVLQYLLQGDLLLIPYDADKNHRPCQKRGHKAHWLLVTGCFLAVNNAEKLIDMPKLEENKDYHERQLFHLQPWSNKIQIVLNTLRHNTDQVITVFIYGHQGKSKHTGVWTLSELLDSNCQLRELGPDRSTDDYLVPQGGVKQGLCGQLIRIFRSDCN